MKPHAAILLIHGIGEIKAGSIIGLSTRGILKEFEQFGIRLSNQRVSWCPDNKEYQEGQVRLHAQRIEWPECLIDLVEFHWAGVRGKIELRHPLDGIRKLLKVLKDVPVMGVSPQASVGFKLVALAVGVIQAILVATILVLACGVIGESLMRPSAPTITVFIIFKNIISGVAVPFWLVTVCAYLFLQLFQWLLSWLHTQTLRKAVILARASVATSVLAFFIASAFIVSAIPFSSALHVVAKLWRNSIWPDPYNIEILSYLFGFLLGLLVEGGPYILLFLLLFWLTMSPALLLGNLLRDTVHYLAPDRNGELQPEQREIRRELWKLFRTLARQGYGRIILIAHSLGSVLAIDVIKERKDSDDLGNMLLVDLVTVGSPYRRLVYRLLPSYGLTALELLQILKIGRQVKVLRWFNVYRIFDYVGQALTYSELSLRSLQKKGLQQGSEIIEHLLTPKFCRPFMHSNYWNDRRFLKFIASDVLLPALSEQACVRVDPPETSITSGSEAPSAVIWDIEEKGSPYPGLMNFTREYAPVFFGRDPEVREIFDRMRLPEGRFILVSGDSGVGKSSVVAAGVLPIIEEHGLPGGESCEILHMLPGKAQQPWANLMMAGLGTLATRAGLRLDDVLAELTRDPDTLPRHIHTIVKKATSSHTLLLFLDQMEELFTSQDLTQANPFLTALYYAAQEKTLWVVATIRSDHLHYCYRHPEMLKVLRSQGHYPLGPVERFMMQEVILQPAYCAGLCIPERLARRLIDDTGEGSANLPFLAFVLNQLFEKRKRTNNELSEAVYKDLRGVTGAIEAHVRAVEDKIQAELGSKAEDVLPSIFQTLVIIQKEGGVPTRNRPPLPEFDSKLRSVINLLVTERLLRTEGEGEAATVSISHEKLFEAWPSLKEYLEDRTLLESRAKKWVDMGKPWFSGLASGREYRDFCQAGVIATQEMKDYLGTSHRAHWMFKGAIAVVAFLIGTTWLWQKGFTVDRALLKVRSLFVSVHVVPQMQIVSDGTFRQGSTLYRGGPEIPEEQPVHEVRIKRFAMGTFEVTFEEYDRFAIAMDRNLPGDEGWGRGRRPVINVSWRDAKEYADWLSQQTGKRYRLPTESEWEYVARSEGKDDIWAGTSDEKQLAEYAVYAANSNGSTQPVGGKKSNSLGVYDMSGNVLEWVEDCAHGNYNDAPADGSAWLEAGGGNCDVRMIRGGSWDYLQMHLRSSFRLRDSAGDRANMVGFRLAHDLP